MAAYLLVGLGGAIGSMLRHAVNILFSSDIFPTGTLIVNTVGSFIIGLIAGLGENSDGIFSHINFKLFLIIGVLGGFTTFSSFSLQTINLFEKGLWIQALGNVILSVVLCLGLAAVGLKLGGKLAL